MMIFFCLQVFKFLEKVELNVKAKLNQTQKQQQKHIIFENCIDNIVKKLYIYYI
jgi:hypothetical protein